MAAATTTRATHSHLHFKTFVTQIKILIRQINGESRSLLNAVLLDLFGAEYTEMNFTETQRKKASNFKIG